MLVLNVPGHAHNGAVGRVADSSGEPWYQLGWTAYGHAPRDDGDLSARFVARMAARGKVLHVIVEVVDESSVIDHSARADWDSQDGCEVFVDWRHDGVVRQYRIYGDQAGQDGAHIVAASAPARRRYAFEIPVPDSMSAHVIGLDVAVIDRDEDGTFTWQTWGRGEGKVTVANRLGDMITAVGEPFGDVRGQVVWWDGQAADAVRVIAERVDRSSLSVTLRTDAQGRFGTSLPHGAYRLRHTGATHHQAVVVPAHGSEPVRMSLSTPVRGDSFHIQPRSGPAGSGRTTGAVTTFGERDGLPGPHIGDIVAVEEQSLWMATSSGALRFDGATLTRYDQDAGLPHNTVQSILRDRSGAIWLGSGWHSQNGVGVMRVDGDRGERFGVEHGVAHSSVLSLLEDRDGNIWAGTFGGLSRFDGRSWRTYNVEDGLGDNIVMALAQDSSGTIWAGTGYSRSGGIVGGLSRFDGGGFHTLTTADGMPSNWVSDVHVARDGALWIATLGGGVARYDGDGFVSWGEPDGLPSQRVWRIDELPGGDLVFATAAGPCRFDGRRCHSVEGSTRHDVYALAVDDPGQLWTGDSFGGLRRHASERLRVFGDARQPFGSCDVVRPGGQVWLPTATGLYVVDEEQGKPVRVSAAGATAVFPRSRGGVWVATSTSAYAFHGGQREVIDAGGRRVTSVHEDALGGVWLGTRGGTILRDAAGVRHVLSVSAGLPHARVLGFADSPNGDVWIATAGGLRRWSDGSLQSVEGLADGRVDVLMADSEGLWLRVTGGIAVLGIDGPRHFGVQDGLPHSQVRVLFRDRTSRLWAGTDSGPAWFDGERFHPARSSTAPVTSIADVGAQVWFGTAGHGVLRFDGTTWLPLAEEEGLPGAHIYDIAVDRSDVVWIATQGGLVRYQPHPGVPQARLTGIATDHPLGPVHDVSVSSVQDYLRIDIQGASLSTPASSFAYVYRLLPMDTTWVSNDDGAFVFDSLPIGSYTFEAIAIDVDFGRSEPLVVAIDVHIPYERTAWTMGLLLATGCVVWLGSRVVVRDRRLQHANERLRAAITDLSTEIQRREQAEAERSRLGREVFELRYLERLRDALQAAESTEPALAHAGEALAQAMMQGPVNHLRIECDGVIWERFLSTDRAASRYERELVWGERRRGMVVADSAVDLEDRAEKVLIDETAAHLARALQTRELTAQLMRSARLMALGQMAAGMAHELNQPLAAISTIAGDVHLRLVEGREPSTDDLKELMVDAMGLVRRMAGTIDHMRVFSRDTSQESGVEFSLHDVVESSLKVIGTQLGNHGIEVITHHGTELPALVGQPFQIEQVLLNLLANARDAIDERVATEPQAPRRIEVKTVSVEDEVEVTVADSGSGVREQDAERLFDPFFTTKPADRGTGLGLSISYAIVQNHGGELGYTTHLGEGTEFRVRLPRPPEGEHP